MGFVTLASLAIGIWIGVSEGDFATGVIAWLITLGIGTGLAGAARFPLTSILAVIFGITLLGGGDDDAGDGF